MRLAQIALDNSASAPPPAEDQASTAFMPPAVDATFSRSATFKLRSSLPRPGSHAAVSSLDQPRATETAAINSQLAVLDPDSETGAATVVPGSASAVAALLDLDAHVDMNMATLRVRAKNSISANSSSA